MCLIPEEGTYKRLTKELVNKYKTILHYFLMKGRPANMSKKTTAQKGAVVTLLVSVGVSI